MEALGAAGLVFCLLALYLGVGTWIFSGLMLVSVTALMVTLDMPLTRAANILKGTMWRS